MVRVILKLGIAIVKENAFGSRDIISTVIKAAVEKGKGSICFRGPREQSFIHDEN
jgi:hypothetical protein